MGSYLDLKLEDGSDEEDYRMREETERPESYKRRRRSPDGLSFGTSRDSSAERRGNGKDGQDVWPTDVEDAFLGGG